MAYKRLILGVLFGALVCCFGCAKEDAKSNQVQVVATTGMIADLVQNIGKEFVDVVSLMGPGVDPHLYRASEGDVSRLAKADIIFYNGLHLEAKMGEILEKMGDRRPVVAISAQMPEEKLYQLPDYGGLHDPHVWFDVQLWMTAIPVVRDKLIELDPENKVFYTQNAALYTKQLAVLDTEVQRDMATIPEKQRILVTAHDAFHYFGMAYGISVRGLQGISTQAEAGTRDVQDLAAYITEKKIPAIFVESSIPERTVKAVQKAVQARGWQVIIGGELFSDAMGDPGSEEGTYLGMVRHNVHVIVTSLGGKVAHKESSK